MPPYPSLPPSSEGLEVRDLSVAFVGALVLRNINMHIGENETVGLVGRNGAGKTTLLRTISGLVAHSADTIIWMGLPLARRSDRVARSGIVHVPEGRGVIANLTTRDNLRLGRIAVGKKLDNDTIASVLGVFPRLAPLLDRHAGLLSGGEQQMLAIARGMVAEPRLLMVDELSLGLAPKVAADIRSALMESARSTRTSLLLVDENVKSLIEACDRIYRMRSGTLDEWKVSRDTDAWRSLFLE